MSLYKSIHYLTPTEDTAFDQAHLPGYCAPHSGIYRCTGCGREVVGQHPLPLPAPDHHRHTRYQSAIRWQMIVYADDDPH